MKFIHSINGVLLLKLCFSSDFQRGFTLWCMRTQRTWCMRNQHWKSPGTSAKRSLCRCASFASEAEMACSFRARRFRALHMDICVESNFHAVETVSYCRFWWFWKFWAVFQSKTDSLWILFFAAAAWWAPVRAWKPGKESPRWGLVAWKSVERVFLWSDWEECGKPKTRYIYISCNPPRAYEWIYAYVCIYVQFVCIHVLCLIDILHIHMTCNYMHIYKWLHDLSLGFLLQWLKMML